MKDPYLTHLLLISSIKAGAFYLSFHIISLSPFPAHTKHVSSPFPAHTKHVSSYFSLVWKIRIWILPIPIAGPQILLTSWTVNKIVCFLNPFLIKVFHMVETIYGVNLDVMETNTKLRCFSKLFSIIVLVFIFMFF